MTFILLMAFTLSFISVDAQDQNNFELSKNIEIYINVLRQLNQNYVDNINPGELTTTAIDAMLEGLDPYTVYIPESKLEDFELMTKGEYGGIGALIQKQGDYVVITEPYEGFPAQKSGLKAGDKIIAVDGESAEGKTTREVSEKLKGVPGTTLTLTVQPFGDTTDQQIEIVREKVKIPNVPYYGMIRDNVGYISLVQFNANAASDVKKAFTDLNDHTDLKGIVLDLRGNGGGLLSEAVDIVNIFVPKGTTVVTTKGKNPENIQVRRTRFAPTDTKIPLVVLVNGNSASASEIVSGAIQDLDRGVIIGERTFGKGLVQNVVPLPYNSRMKLTIAKYYIPSGRCIQAIDYFNRHGNGEPDKIPDSLISEFKTADGRSVFDGKGINPDIKIKMKPFSQVTADLYAQNYIFNFTNEFVLNHPKISSPEDFVITDEEFNNFKDYVTKQDFDYQTETETLIKRLNKSAEREGYLKPIKPLLDSLDRDVKKEKLHDIDKNRKQIEELIRIEIVTRYYYQRGKVIAALLNDPDLAEAVKVLNDHSMYHSILIGTYAKKETGE